MGMGEATWIQAAVKGGLLGHAPVSVVPDERRGDEPFRAECERTWCEATSGLDLMHAEGQGTRIVVR